MNNSESVRREVDPIWRHFEQMTACERATVIEETVQALDDIAIAAEAVGEAMKGFGKEVDDVPQ